MSSTLSTLGLVCARSCSIIGLVSNSIFLIQMYSGYKGSIISSIKTRFILHLVALVNVECITIPRINLNVFIYNYYIPCLKCKIILVLSIFGPSNFYTSVTYKKKLTCSCVFLQVTVFSVVI